MPDTICGNNMSILYVEDEAATREQVSRLLISKGYRLLIAENGAAGLELYHQNKPDIILTDIMMPHMNGLEMSRAVRDVDPDAQIICMTAFSDTSYMVEAIDIGINQFVVKPVDFKRLLASIDHCRKVIELRTEHRKLEAEALRSRKMEAIGILAGGMAHDFNNLLQVILGYVSLARMNAIPGSKTEELLKIAEKSSGTARELGKRLLTFAKGGEAFMQVTDLKPHLLSGLAEALDNTPVILNVTVPDSLPPLNIDPIHIRQVVVHIATNAREAMSGGGTLTVSASAVTLPEQNSLALAPGEYLHVIFEDCGTGIPEENLSKIFDPYYSTKEFGSQKGTGLGLPLCYSIIRHHHGQIQAESKPGKGTRIHVYLPALPRCV